MLLRERKTTTFSNHFPRFSTSTSCTSPLFRTRECERGSSYKSIYWSMVDVGDETRCFGSMRYERARWANYIYASVMFSHIMLFLNLWRDCHHDDTGTHLTHQLHPHMISVPIVASNRPLQPRDQR